MRPRWANVATVLALAGLFAGVSVTAPRWARFLRRELPPAVEEEPRSAGADPTPAPTSGAEAAEAERKISVKLFFEAPDRPGLVLEDRTIPVHGDLSRQLRVVVEELIRGSESGLLSPIAPGTRVLDVFVTARGVAYVDLSKEVAEGHLGGTQAELLTVYSIVNSIAINFPSVRRVQILVEDRPAATLAGHVDVSRPLRPDLTLLAASTLTPAPSPSPSLP